MTKTEILTKIDEIETRLFMIQMVDRWTYAERQADSKLRLELKELKAQLEKM